MAAVADAKLHPGQVKFGIKSAYPFKRLLNRFEQDGVVDVWYPWYYITLGVEMDTYLKKGMSYRDLVAVDALRPIRERVQGFPEITDSNFSEGVKLEPKISDKEAKDEAEDLLKGIVLSRNKLLKEYSIEVEKTSLIYHKTFVVKLKGVEPGDWLYIDSHFDAATTLKMRPEVYKHIQKG
ncbi:MAG: hypothetical protein EA390_13860 [Balneolaceae bacterium]|nr:MAG: hypothetical protein EA390_13860 [Balneolaceae bacterium]